MSNFVLKWGEILLQNVTESFKFLLKKIRFEPNLTEHDFRMLAGLRIMSGFVALCFFILQLTHIASSVYQLNNINVIDKWPNFSNNGASEMEIGSFDGREDGEYNNLEHRTYFSLE